MKCRFCNEEIPDNSDFCLICGRNIKDIATTPMQAQESTNFNRMQSIDSVSSSVPISTEYRASHRRNRFCKYCGGLIDSETRKCTSCGKKLFSISIKTLLIVLMALLLMASIAFLVIQRTSFMKALSAVETELSEKESFIHTLKTDNVSLEDKIRSLNDQLDESQKNIALLEKDSKTLDTILAFLQSSNAGSSSSKFKASDKIFVVDKNDIQTSFTLTCGFSGYTTISTQSSGTSADIVFTQNEWYGATTKLLISPKRVGTTIITFSNDQNTQTFRILIVVIE